jgi:beta-1,4-N-acetylglucosaminyltransferase
MKISSAITFITVVIGLSAVFLLRLLWILPAFRTQSRSVRKASAKIVIVLGSGGHTAEMLRLIEPLSFEKYGRRVYVVSSGDTLSEAKARALEERKKELAGEKGVNFCIDLILILDLFICAYS